MNSTLRCVILVAAMAGAATAVVPKTWYIASAKDVERGDVEGLSVGDDGRMALAPTFEEIGDTEEAFVWSLAEDDRGRIYAATGTQGRLYLLEPGVVPELVFDSPQTQLQAVAIGPDGFAYAGSVPDGIVYRISPEGTARVFAHTGETYVWDLEFNAAGYLYAATGTGGVVLKIDPTGLVIGPVLDSNDRHIMALEPDGYGGFYAGTEGNGLVYHINDDDEARLIFSAEEKEIHTMVLGPDGKLYIGAVHGRRNGSDDDDEERAPGGGVYRLEPSGAGTKIWQAPYPLILSMAVQDEDHILVGVGPRGVLYRIGVDGEAERVSDLGESQPTAMLSRADGSVLIGMGNSGMVKRLGDAPGLEGAFTSDTYDAELVTTWGRVEMHADAPSGTRIALESRTGNDDDPAHDWSAWRGVRNPAGGVVESPAARFIQFRATFSRTDVAPTPALHSLAFTGQQVNVAPVLAGARVAPYRQARRRSSNESGNGDDASERPATSRSSSARENAKRSLVMVRWGASDPNSDDLAYDLSYRRVGDEIWKDLKSDVTRQYVLWDTEGAPEGLTVVRVHASDRPANPWTIAQSDEVVTEPFLIDYTGPVVTSLESEIRPDGAVRIRGTGQDATGGIHSGAYSIDSGEWLVFFPDDGMFDSPEERIDFVTEILEPGSHTIVVRLKDALENVGATSVDVVVPDR